jgi:hypothetical protein
MNKPKFTLGPWYCSRGDSFDHSNDGKINGFEILLNSADPLATARCRLIDRIRYAEDIFPEDAEYSEAEANAHLIAAAPELYDVLYALMIAESRWRDYVGDDLLMRAEAALAKARGKTGHTGIVRLNHSSQRCSD